MESLIKRRKFENQYIANFKDFPDEIIWKMFDFLDIKSLKAFCKTSLQMYTNCIPYMKFNINHINNLIEEEKIHQFFIYMINIIISNGNNEIVSLIQFRGQTPTNGKGIYIGNGNEIFIYKSWIITDINITRIYFKTIGGKNYLTTFFDIKIDVKNNSFNFLNKEAYYEALYIFIEKMKLNSYNMFCPTTNFNFGELDLTDNIGWENTLINTRWLFQNNSLETFYNLKKTMIL
jgi:hypothetical protein